MPLRYLYLMPLDCEIIVSFANAEHKCDPALSLHTLCVKGNFLYRATKEAFMIVYSINNILTILIILLISILWIKLNMWKHPNLWFGN